MATILKQPLTIIADTGVTASNDGVNYDASEQVIQVISIGQNVGINDNVQFNQVTGSSIRIGGVTFSDNGIVSGNLNITSGTDSDSFDYSMGISANLIITGSATSSGLTYGSITATTMTSASGHSSGSNIFGNDINDSQQFSGSIELSGSLVINGYSINEISNDTSLDDSNTTSLITENAVKVYADANVGANTVEPYLRKNFNKTASTISNNTASFSAVSASAPDGITATSETDFLFFNNGQIMEHNALTIEQSGSTFMLISDPSSIGYNLESDDEIKAWGRFNA